MFIFRIGIPWEYLPRELGCGSGTTFALLVVDKKVGLFDAEDKPFERERILDNINSLIRSAHRRCAYPGA